MRYRTLRRRWYNSTLSMEGVFGTIFQHNLWNDAESVSGPGSNLKVTEGLRRELPPFLAQLGVNTLLDAPCGDFYWLSKTDLKLDRYIGVDVVPDLIERNRAAYGNSWCEFRVVDITRDQLPKADLILNRDCLIHFSYRHIWVTLRNFRQSGATYLLTTTDDQVARNEDIVTGDFRRINLALDPFNFPPPLARLADPGPVDDPGRCLALWRLCDLPDR